MHTMTAVTIRGDEVYMVWLKVTTISLNLGQDSQGNKVDVSK